MRGTMRWFNEERGEGVIEAVDGTLYTVAADQFAGGHPKGRCSGMIVEFQSAEGARAEQVVFPEEGDPRRARTRRPSRASI